eukprot:scaffold261377_cov29-Tisochrysis_lutea.AAC.1
MELAPTALERRDVGGAQQPSVAPFSCSVLLGGGSLNVVFLGFHAALHGSRASETPGSRHERPLAYTTAAASCEPRPCVLSRAVEPPALAPRPRPPLPVP